MLTWPARIPLAVLPTPLVCAPRLSAVLEREIWIKRDDLTGFAVGGNKVRPLEVLVADALERGCDHLVGCGGPSSNLCTVLAAAAANTGLACTLVLYGEEPPAAAVHPNLAMMRAFGARVVFTGDPDRAATTAYAAGVADRLQAERQRPYVIARGAASGLGATAYARAAEELVGQLTFRPAHVVVAAGSGATVAGLLAGWEVFDVPGRVVGVAVSRAVDETRDEISRLASEAAGILGVHAPGTDRLLVLDGLGAGFGRPDRGTREAAHLAFRTEGVLADATYVARAVATLDSFDGPLVLWHTGGWLGFVGDALGVNQ